MEVDGGRVKKKMTMIIIKYFIRSLEGNLTEMPKEKASYHAKIEVYT